VAKLGHHGLGAGAVPPERGPFAEGSDVLEPALEQPGNRDWLDPRTVVLDLDQEAGEFGLGLALAALEESPDLDGLALRVTAQVDPQLLGSWATLSHGAFACHVLFVAQSWVRARRFVGTRAPPRRQPQRTNEQVRDARRGARAAESGSLLMS
jgi:hypothetical protein